MHPSNPRYGIYFDRSKSEPVKVYHKEITQENLSFKKTFEKCINSQQDLLNEAITAANNVGINTAAGLAIQELEQFLLNLECPARGSDAENWDINNAASEAGKILHQLKEAKWLK